MNGPIYMLSIICDSREDRTFITGCDILRRPRVHRERRTVCLQSSCDGEATWPSIRLDVWDEHIHELSSTERTPPNEFSSLPHRNGASFTEERTQITGRNYARNNTAGSQQYHCPQMLSTYDKIDQKASLWLEVVQVASHARAGSKASTGPHVLRDLIERTKDVWSHR